MRITTLVALAAAAALALPTLSANDAKPPSGTHFKLRQGQTATVNVVGTQNCSFEVLAMSGDAKVATVSASPEAGKKQKVTIEGVAPGTTSVSIQTVNGSIPACEGFVFNYTVEVEADFKAFAKQAKGKLKDAGKDVKDTVQELTDAYCDEIGLIAEAFLAGELTADEALEEAFDAGQDVLDLVEAVIDPYLDQVFADVWSRGVIEVGLLGITDDVIGLLPGGCGDWDKFEDDVSKALDKLEATFVKKFKQFEKTLDKALGGDGLDLLMVIVDPSILVALDEPVPLPADPPQVPAPPAPKNLEKTWTAAGRVSDSPVSRLHAGGQADPGAGDVTVMITGPDGASAMQTVTVDAKTCAWRVEFPGIKPGDYVVTLTQAGVGPVMFKTTVP